MKEVNFKSYIENQLKEEINKSYTEYKVKCLEELDTEMEFKRNRIVQNILNSIVISTSQSEMSLIPNINIRVEPKVIIKKEDM